MHLFTRQVVMRGNPRDAIAFAKGVRALVDERAPFDVSLFQGLFMPATTCVFSTIVDSRATFLAGQAQLLADDDYLDLLDKGLEFFVEPPQDRLVGLIHAAGGEVRRAEVGNVVTHTIAVADTDRTAQTLTWSTEMAELVARITGVPVYLGMVEHGTFGELQWTSVLADIAEVDRVTELLAKDEDYLAHVDRAKGHFVPGATHENLAIRIA